MGTPLGTPLGTNSTAPRLISPRQEVYGKLEEPDGLEGLVKLRQGGPRPEDQRLAAEKAGNWAEAATLYEQALQHGAGGAAGSGGHQGAARRSLEGAPLCLSQAKSKTMPATRRAPSRVLAVNYSLQHLLCMVTSPHVPHQQAWADLQQPGGLQLHSVRYSFACRP